MCVCKTFWQNGRGCAIEVGFDARVCQQNIQRLRPWDEQKWYYPLLASETTCRDWAVARRSVSARWKMCYGGAVVNGEMESVEAPSWCAHFRIKR